MAATIAAVLVRWVFCFLIFPHFLAAHSTVGTTYYFDSYREIASSLWSGRGYRLGPDGPPALHRPPTYAVLVMLANPGDAAHCYIWLHLIQGLLGGIAVFVTYRAARAWDVDDKGAVFACWLVALWPFAIWETKVSVPENLLFILLPLTFWLAATVGASILRALVLGLVAAVLALTHPLYQVGIVPLVVVVIARRSCSARRLHLVLVVMLAAFAMPLAAWAARNHRVGYLGLTTGFGFHYFKGEYDFEQLTEGRPYFRDNDIPAGQYVDRILQGAGLAPIDTNEERSDSRINRYLDHLAMRDMQHRPAHTLAKMAIKMPLAWVQQQSPARSVVTLILLVPVFCLAIAGLRRQPSLWPLAIAVLILNAAAALVFIEAMPMRYALPWMPLLGVIAGAGVTTPATEYQGPTAEAAAAALINTAAVFRCALLLSNRIA